MDPTLFSPPNMKGHEVTHLEETIYIFQESAALPVSSSGADRVWGIITHQFIHRFK
jgi:hypothetical protein